MCTVSLYHILKATNTLKGELAQGIFTGIVAINLLVAIILFLLDRSFRGKR